MIRTWILSLAVCLACNAQADDSHTAQFEGVDPYEPVQVFQVLPPNMADPSPLRVKYDRLSNMPSSLKSKILATKTKLDKVLASDAFYKAVLAHKYGGKKTFVGNKGLSNEQIYDKIQMGKELFNREVDRLMNLEVESYYENSNTVGYTYTRSRTIYVNRKFYNNYTSSQIARNLMHEWLHKVGFSHDVNATSRRPYSVPYAIGSIVERLAKTM